MKSRWPHRVSPDIFWWGHDSHDIFSQWHFLDQIFTPSSLPNQTLTGSLHPGYSSSIGNAVSNMTASLITSFGVFSVTLPLQRESTSILLDQTPWGYLVFTLCRENDHYRRHHQDVRNLFWKSCMNEIHEFSILERSIPYRSHED